MTRVTSDHVIELMRERSIQKEKAFNDLPYGDVISMSVEAYQEFKVWFDEHRYDNNAASAQRNAGYTYNKGIGLKIAVRSDSRDIVLLAKLQFGGM